MKKRTRQVLLASALLIAIFISQWLPAKMARLHNPNQFTGTAVHGSEPEGAQNLAKIRKDVSKIRESLWSAQVNGFLKAEDFEKLDFSTGDALHGWNPAYSGTENSGARYFISGPHMDDYLKVHIADFTEPGTEPAAFVNLRRFEDRYGEIKDTLALFIPHALEEPCKSYAGLGDTTIVVAKDNKSLIQDRSWTSGCFRGDDDSIYLAIPMLTRVMHKSGHAWRIERN